VIGWTAGTINFAADWGGTDSKGPTGFWQAEYLTRVNADGSYGWTRILGVSGGSWMTPGGVATDGSGNVYLSGTFMGTEDFRADWGSPTDSKTSAGGIDDAFVTKVMADGSYGWTRVIGSSNNDSAYGVCADGAGNVVVTGFFDGTVDFRADWGGSTDSKTSAGGTDAFVTLVNADGSYGWTRRMGGTGWDEGRAVAVGATGATAVVGVFAVTVDFKADWGGGSDTKTAASQNAFVVRFR
jgi:hypothetical protein